MESHAPFPSFPSSVRAYLLFLLLLIVGFVLYLRVARARGTPQTARVAQVKERLWTTLVHELKKQSFKPGAHVYIRVFKESSELELWLRDHLGGRFRKFSTYRIATWGGKGLGPKLKEGDGMAPEGCYMVTAKQLNPESKFHLSFDLGYPNGFDRSLGRTGSHVMVHGGAVSIGCFAMTDPQIEIIYLLVEAALRANQGAFQVHIYPFRMTAERLDKEKDNPWHPFWTTLKTGYDLFEKDRVPPLPAYRDHGYVFQRQEPR